MGKWAWDLGKPFTRVWTLHPTFLLVTGDFPLSDFRKVKEEAQTQGCKEGGTGHEGLRSVPGIPVLLSPVSIGIGV